jgi:hypothetical protein
VSLDLKVIGAGLGRTGTTSLKIALEMLLKGPCFHFLEYRSHPELMDPWQSLIQTMPLRSNPDTFRAVPLSEWETVMPGYVACVDEPASLYWKQLSDLFPEALVVLSVRDTDSWWESMMVVEERYQEEMKRPDLIPAQRRAFLEFVDAIYPDWHGEIAESAEKTFFEAHNRRVLEHAQRDRSFNRRFLVWRATDGWEPLCKALDIPVPDQPFPHENRRSEYHGY